MWQTGKYCRVKISMIQRREQEQPEGVLQAVVEIFNEVCGMTETDAVEAEKQEIAGNGRSTGHQATSTPLSESQNVAIPSTKLPTSTSNRG